MTLLERYELYRNSYHKKHGSFFGCRGYDGWIKQNRKKTNKGFKYYSLFACDFETTYHKEFTDADIVVENRSTSVDELTAEFEPDKHSRVFLSGIMNINTEEFHVEFEEIETTFNYIAKQTFHEKHKSAIVWYHNLVYDGSYILKWLINHGYNQTTKTVANSIRPLLKHKQFSCLISGGKYFNITIKWKGITITFLDSLKLIPMSLASLGETIGFPKLKDTVDYKKFKIRKDRKYPKVWITYLERDCLILCRILKEFFTKEPKSKSTIRTTIGSVSYSHIKAIVKANTWRTTIEDFYEYQKWYNGGLTFPSKKYQGKWVYRPQQIKMVDACSMYPSQMIKPLPYGVPSMFIDSSWDSYCAYHTIWIKKATIKEKYKELSVMPKPYKWIDNVKKIRVENDEFGNQIKYIHQYVSAVENSEYHFIDCEWEIMKKLYDIEFEITDTIYFETRPYLKQIVSEMFVEKQQASLNNDDVLKVIAKLKLNNLYGKTGQKPNRVQDYYGSIDSIDTDKFVIIGKKNTDVEAYNIQKKKELHDKAQPVHVAAYITALARVNLLEKYIYIKENKGEFLYCDTDSICFVDSKQQIKLLDVGNDLGCWEFETVKTAHGKTTMIGDGFISLCPKQYRVVKIGADTPLKLACAGANKELMKKVKNQHYNYDISNNTLYKLAKRSLKNGLHGKYIDENTPFSFKKWNKILKNPKCPKELYN